MVISQIIILKHIFNQSHQLILLQTFTKFTFKFTHNHF